MPVNKNDKIDFDTYFNNDVIGVSVPYNDKLSQQIFSFIPDVEVLSPDWLRQEIKAKIEENLQKYLSMQNGCTN